MEWLKGFFSCNFDSGMLFAAILVMGGLLYKNVVDRLDILEGKIDQRNGYEAAGKVHLKGPNKVKIRRHK
jgi:hypothetical protein